MMSNMTIEGVAAQPRGAAGNAGQRPDRRARRRQETIAEILDIASEIMTEEGVNGLSLAEIARRLGVQPPSLYKYFPSLMAVYDELFRRGQAEHLAIMRDALSAAAPGLTALTAGLEASGRWLLAHRAIAQLMFWRPVPNFEPSAEAFAPSAEMVALQRAAMADAVAAGQLGPEADSDEAIDLVSTLIVGVLSQAIANEPGLGWGEGRFTTQFPRLMKLLIAAYPPRPRPQSQVETSDPSGAAGPAAVTSVLSAESQPAITVGAHT
jgi:AcrR family transcriptional regulator